MPRIFSSTRWIFSSLLLSILLISSPLVGQTNTEPPAAPEQDAKETPAELTGDQKLQAQLVDVFSQIPAFKDLKVTVRSGLVVISGALKSGDELKRVDALARRLEGVLEVENSSVEVQDKEPSATEQARANDERIKQQLQQIFSQVKTFKDFSVTVSEGVVTLSGVAVDSDNVDEAKKTAKSIEGVVFVVDDITVTTELSKRVSPAVEKIKALTSKFLALLPLIGISILVILLFAWLGRMITKFDSLFSRFTDKPLIRGILKQAVKTVMIFIGIVIALEILDATSLAGAVLGGAGVAGIALGFAFQDIVENYLASMILSFRQPFSKGDAIKIGDHEGIVVKLTTRDTVLMTYDGNHLRIPNAQVFKSVLYNYSLNPKRRFEFAVGVSADANLTQVKSMGLNAIKGVPGILLDPAPFMLIKELGDSSIVCTFYGWVDQSNHGLLAVRTESVRRVKLTLEREGVDMPEPIYRLNIKEHAMLDDSMELPDPPSKHEPIDTIEEDSTLQDEANEEKHLKNQLDAGDEDEPDLLSKK